MRYSNLAALVFFGVAIQAQAQTAATTRPQPVPPTSAEVAAAKARIEEGGARVSPRQRAELARAEAAIASQGEGDTFINNYRRKPGVKPLPSGALYRVIKAHSGKSPGQTSKVGIRYVGTLPDGSGFDKVEDKAGSKLLLSGLVPGLQDALRHMSVGAKWEVVIPPSLGYGSKGTHAVAPNSVLIYEVELLSVE